MSQSTSQQAFEKARGNVRAAVQKITALPELATIPSTCIDLILEGYVSE
jgi:hypothetical protein